MPTFLFTVDDVFDIGSRYLIPTPGVPVCIRGIRGGLPLELRRPDGVMLQTAVASIEMPYPCDPARPTQIGLQGLAKQDIPIETEIWTTGELSPESSCRRLG